MKKSITISSLLLVMVSGMSLAQGLPQWSAADQARLKKGELVAGAVLLVDDTLPNSDGGASVDAGPVPLLPLPDGVLDASDVSSDGESSTVNKLIPEEYWADYFSKMPEGYLVDPQRLFSNQETLDQEGFLGYYADEAEVNVRIYLFDHDQQIPSAYSLQRLINELYADGPLTAVVFYYLGNPDRNQLMFGGEGRELVQKNRLRSMLDVAKIKAMEKSNFASQMESFIVQLSISIYWVEQDMAEARAEDAAEKISTSVDGQKENKPVTAPGTLSKLQPYLLYAVVGLLSVLSATGAVVVGWVIWRRSRRYYFPVLDFPTRLGAGHAAGVGAVMGFHNKLDSPSSQRDQTPDYLTRI